MRDGWDVVGTHEWTSSPDSARRSFSDEVKMKLWVGCELIGPWFLGSCLVMRSREMIVRGVGVS